MAGFCFVMCVNICDGTENSPIFANRPNFATLLWGRITGPQWRNKGMHFLVQLKEKDTLRI